MWRSAAWTVSCSSGGRLSRAKPFAALDPEQIGARRLALKPAHQHRVHLVLYAGCGCGPAARGAPAAAAARGRARRASTPPQARPSTKGSPACGRRACRSWCAPARSRCRRARPPPPARREARGCAPPPTRRPNLHRHPVAGRQARGQRLKRLRGHLHPARRAHHPVLADRDLAEIAVQVKADRPTGPPMQRLHLLHDQSPPSRVDKTGEAAGERHRPIRARSTIRASRRGGHRKARARSPSSKTACRLRSPRRPLSRITRPYARGRTEPPRPGFSCPDEREHGSTVLGPAVREQGRCGCSA